MQEMIVTVAIKIIQPPLHISLIGKMYKFSAVRHEQWK